MRCVKRYISKVGPANFCFPGNADLEIAINIDVDILNFKKILKFIKFSE